MGIFDSKTLGEWIGRKDEDGKEIYEGDFLSPSEYLAGNGPQLVMFEDGWFVTDGELQFDECAKVLGNIYDNPGLRDGGGGELKEANSSD